MTIPALNSGLSDRYLIERELGSGGMATVFLAQDLRHHRKVALKVLRPELAAVLGADRFLREIEIAAGLNHPHILPLFDSGRIPARAPDQPLDILYYVMPLVQGESLRDRLEREGQLPVDEAVSITTAIASGLDYAHRQGILHRDIKPENILLHDRQPLLADFGIALAVSSAGSRLTNTGFSVGTPSYMSPEQVAGETRLDARSDVYALSCVAYEMLAGEPPFTGLTPQAVAAAVMTGEAKALTDRRRTVPEAVAAAIHRGLERLPADRYASAMDFSAALRAEHSPAPRLRTRRPVPVSWIVLALVAGVLLGVFAGKWRKTAAPVALRRWNLVLPEEHPVALAGPSQASGWQTAIALSPKGDQLAYVAPRGGTTELVTRALDADSVTVVPGTEGAYHPFYSPDGSAIGFFSGNLLRKVSASGGSPVTLVQVDRITGAVWASADRILVLENEGFDLHWVSASGAAADSVVHLTTQFGTPDILPGGLWAAGQLSSGQLALLSLTDGTELAVTRRGVLPMDSVRQADLLFGTSPRWVPPDHLVYAAGDGILTAIGFDGARRKVLGEPVPLLTGVRMESGYGYGEFAVSGDGTLVYVPGGNQLWTRVAMVTPQGRIDTLGFPRAQYTQPRVSPDGTRLAVQLRNPVGGWTVLVMDLATGMRRTVEVEGNYRAFPASWLPSGQELMIGIWNPVQFLNYGARIQSLVTGQWSDIHLTGASYMTVAPDGKSFVFSDWRTGDLYLRGLGSDTSRTRIPGRGFAASFSPDGRWVAWGGLNGSVTVSPVPPTGATYEVAERGQMPLWTPRGDGLIYRDGVRYYRVPVTTAGGFHSGRPSLLVEGPFLAAFGWNHAMAPDGRLLVLLGGGEQRAPALGVIAGFGGLVSGKREQR